VVGAAWCRSEGRPPKPKTITKATGGGATEPRRDSKSAAVVALLRHPDGASLDGLTEATGWQKHTARAALTGLKKKGHTIDRIKADGVSRYRITSSAAL